MDNEAVKKEICITYEYSYLHDDWVQPLGEALEGITFEEAVWRAGPKSKGIWEIVLHLAVWIENIIERIQTSQHCRPAEGAWPSLPEVRNDATWAAAQKRLWDALDRFRIF